MRRRDRSLRYCLLSQRLPQKARCRYQKAQQSSPPDSGTSPLIRVRRGLIGYVAAGFQYKGTMQPVRELQHVDARRFRDEVASSYEPVVMRGLVASWPAVRSGRTSPAHISRYLAQFDNGRDVDAILLPPQACGEIGYDASMEGFNFVRNRLPVSAVIEQLSRYARFDKAPAVAVQSALIEECLPGFARENVLDILESGVAPRIWI